MDWKADMANWSMFTPWPYSDLYRELEDQVEVFDFEKYNFVTPIMKPATMDRAELLDCVMKNYRRFYFNRSLFSYPWDKDPMRRKYLRGCLKAYLKAAFGRKFYDLGKFGYWGPHTLKKLRWNFDKSRQLDEAVNQDEVAAWKSRSERKEAEATARVRGAHAAATAKAAKACGGSTQQMADDDEPRSSKAGLVKACGGGTEQLPESVLPHAPDR